MQTPGLVEIIDIVGIQVLEQHDVSHLASINEAAALSFRSQYIDIYTSSWGPADDGKTVDGPTWATRKGIENGILKVIINGEGTHFFAKKIF